MSILRCVFAVAALVFLASMSVAARADECPVQVLSVDLEGKGIAGHVYRYRVVLNARSSANVGDVGLQIHAGPNHSPIRAVASQVEMSSGEDSFSDVVIFERPKEDVTGVAVIDTESGNIVTSCSSPTVNVGDQSTVLTGWDTPTVIVTLDDSTISPPATARTAIESGDTKNWKFKYTAPLEYPQDAEDKNVTGTAHVHIRIGPQGEPDDVRIATSSGSRLLDDAALRAAKQSTFIAAEYDGLQVPEVDSTFEFALDLGGGVAGSGPLHPSEMLRFCPAVLNGISLDADLSSGSAHWYDIGLITTSTRFDGVSVAVVGQKSPATTLNWRTNLNGVDRTVGLGYFSSEGALFWPGDALAAGAVQGATPQSKAQTICKRFGTPVGNTVDKDETIAVVDTDRPWLAAPVIETVLPARFESVSWPKYVPSPADPAGAIALDVRVHVTESGTPLVAIGQKTSLAPAFAAAALNAAMTSTYVVPRTADGIPLTQTFSIVYLFVPASAPAGKPVGLVSLDRSDGNRRRPPHD
jgi:TonB family protein